MPYRYMLIVCNEFGLNTFILNDKELFDELSGQAALLWPNHIWTATKIWSD